MMEPAEAIEMLKELNENYFQPDEPGEYDDANEALEKAINALEKQTPKKLKKIEIGSGFGYKCICGRLYQSMYDVGKNYCGECGQALNWEG